MADKSSVSDRIRKQEADLDGSKKSSRVRWILGWVVAPGSFLTLLFLAGMHVGARFPDWWLTRLLAWIAD